MIFSAAWARSSGLMRLLPIASLTQRPSAARSAMRALPLVSGVSRGGVQRVRTWSHVAECWVLVLSNQPILQKKEQKIFSTGNFLFL